MVKSKKTIYWDTCVFLAWLKNENRELGEIEGIEEVSRSVGNNRINLTTSVITFVEILESSLGQEGVEKLSNIFKRRNVVPINVDIRIAKLAADIRDHYKKIERSIKTPDAIHLATAINYKVDELQTFDGSRGRPGLLSLNGNVMGYNLKIVQPQKNQSSFRFPIPPDEPS